MEYCAISGFSSGLCYYWDSRFQGRKTRSRTGGREIAIIIIMPTTRRSSRKSSKGVQKATPQPRLPASGGESSPELTPAEKRKATMARNAEEARRLAAAEPDERDVRAGDAEQDQQGRESEVDQLREKVRQYEELWEQRAALNERRAELDQRDDGLAKRRAVLTEAAQRLRALAPKDLGGHRANASRSEQGPEKDDGPIEEQPEWMTTLHTVMIYLIRKFLTDYHVTLPVFKNPELHLALTALIVEAKSLHFGGRTFHDVIDLIKLVETNCDSLTINLGSRVQDRARGYMSRLLLNMRQDLNSTLRTLCGHEALVESCVADFLVGVRHASALGLDLRALMLEELRKVLSDWNTKMRGRALQAAILAESMRLAAPAPAPLQFPAYQPAHTYYQQQLPPPPPGLGYPASPRVNAPASHVRTVAPPPFLTVTWLVGWLVGWFRVSLSLAYSRLHPSSVAIVACIPRQSLVGCCFRYVRPRFPLWLSAFTELPILLVPLQAP